MTKRTLAQLLVLLVAITAAGCRKPGVVAGDGMDVNETLQFCLTYAEPWQDFAGKNLKGDDPLRAVDDVGKKMGKHVVIPSERLPLLLEGASWEAPEGVSITNPHLEIQTAKLHWTERQELGNQTFETNYSVDGYRLVVTCHVDVAGYAQPGDRTLRLRLPQLKAICEELKVIPSRVARIEKNAVSEAPIEAAWAVTQDGTVTVKTFPVREK